MKVRILSFGIARDITGAGAFDLDLPEGADLGILQEYLLRQYPAFKRLSSLMFAVNARYATGDTKLRDEDEVALIPPVSGG